MKDAMTHLAEAVKVSLEIQNLKESLESIPIKVRELEGTLQEISTDYEDKKKAKERFDSERKKLEQALQTDAEYLKAKEERLNSIKTQKEYQAVLREIATTKTSNRSREDQIKTLAANLESLHGEISPLEEKVTSLQAELEREKSNIQGSLDELSGKIKQLEDSLHKQLSALPDDIRDKYRRIQGKKSPPAALVVQGTCQECFMNLPPQLYIEIQKQHEVITCPNCHRLLYLEA
jgi:predicted  nucleic acid-binding Zn-ribbon protein